TAAAARLRRPFSSPFRDWRGPSPSLRPGLSIFTLCWNHGVLLEESVRSGLAALDALSADEQGELLVLDDASSDSTGRVATGLAEQDTRVRVIRSEVNLGLALARSTLLHAATTTHAFQLDADNTALPEGVTALYRAATATGAALTYGTVVQVGADGTALGPISNEPPSPALFQANYVDTMAVTDVAAFRDLGGWSPDPLLEHVDDWAAVHRVVEAGLLLAFVPTLVGRYRVLETAFHRSVGDPRLGAARVARVFDPTGRRRGPHAMDEVAAVAYDPVVGPLWATPAAVALRPDLAPAPPATPAPATPRARILVVAPGGVANAGDDAITVQGLDRLRRAVGDGVDLDLATDGADLPADLGPIRWLGPLIDLLPGLDYEHLGRLDAALASAAEKARIGEGHWRALDPGAYDAAVVLGGGSLASGWSAGLVGPRAVLGAALRTAEVPYALSGQGIGPLDDPEDESLVAGLLAGAAAVACRDESSAALARTLRGVDPAQAVVTGDDALGLVGAVRTAGRRPYLAVTVRSAAYVGGREGDDLAREWVLAADAVAAERGWDVVGVALNSQAPDPEVATLARIRATTPLQAEWHLVECGTDPRRLVAEVAGAEAVAAQSFHAALLALAAGVPAALGAATPYYQAKAAGLASQTGLPGALAVRDPADLATSLAEVSRALAEEPDPLAATAEAVDTWWATLPGALRLDRAPTR
ncbi:MAG: polysaccharide pyruvyl transferase family protein, partial [Iamia sp.]